MREKISVFFFVGLYAPRKAKRELCPMTESRWLRCVRMRWATVGGNWRGAKVLLRC